MSCFLGPSNTELFREPGTPPGLRSAVPSSPGALPLPLPLRHLCSGACPALLQPLPAPQRAGCPGGLSLDFSGPPLPSLPEQGSHFPLRIGVRVKWAPTPGHSGIQTPGEATPVPCRPEAEPWPPEQEHQRHGRILGSVSSTLGPRVLGPLEIRIPTSQIPTKDRVGEAGFGLP